MSGCSRKESSKMKVKKMMMGAAMVALVTGSILYMGQNGPHHNGLTGSTVRTDKEQTALTASNGGHVSIACGPSNETLPEDVSYRLRQLDADVRQRLIAEPLFCGQIRQAPPSVRVKLVDTWVDWMSDNFCREFLHMVSQQAYNADGLKRLDLPNAKAACPRGVSLEETLKYVNGKLDAAFHDKYTVVLPPQSAKANYDAIEGKESIAGGIGVSFTLDHTRLVEAKSSDTDKPAPGNSPAKEEKVPAFTGLIFHVMSGGPDAKAGLNDGDIIEKADGVELIGLDNNYVIEHHLRGAPGTKVSLTINSGNARYDVTLLRSAIIPDTIWGRWLKSDVYAIIVPLWGEGASQKIHDELMTAKQLGARKIIVDVRNNPGGLFDEALQAASYFIKDGVVVRAHERSESDDDLAPPAYHSHVWERRGGKLFMVTRNDGDAENKFHEVPVKGGLTSINPVTGKEVEQAVDIPFIDGLPPVVVLGNGGSGSASEIFIGALKQNARGDGKIRQGGKFVGEPTFGKGIKQATAKAPLGTQILATDGRYYLPDGYWPGDAGDDRRPIKPDIEVAQPEGALIYTPGDAQLMKAIELSNEEAALEAGKPSEEPRAQ